jgi:hypothetical protein
MLSTKRQSSNPSRVIKVHCRRHRSYGGHVSYCAIVLHILNNSWHSSTYFSASEIIEN